MELNKKYIIDLSQAQTPADIVFELSNIIENPDAANQDIMLKLGAVDLNQSQILSINSLINSINSTLTVVETQSEVTKSSVSALGISTDAVEEEIEKSLVENTPEAPLPQDEPSQQYIPMTEHEDSTIEEVVDVNDDLSTDEPVEDVVEEVSTNETVDVVVETNDASSDNSELDIPAPSNIDVFAELKAEIEKDESNNLPNDEVQEELDSIFDSEAKLENILSDEKELNDMKNWPLTKEGDEFEIPEEVMTDEDYEILQMNTQYHKQTVRSGQVIQSKGNVVIIGDCHPGCEIQAAGDITVWGILGGIAHAGCNGNTKAKIRALTLNAIQLRIADSFARRPDHIKNVYVEKTNSFTPEEARNINGSIVILKINDK